MAACPSCGAPHADRARFCAECGAALASATPAREVRKIVTVLFADVTGSTALGERLDPEAVRRVMGRYFETARAIIERHGGTVEKFIGDAVMAVFGIPVVHEDDALRAVRAAAELRETLRELDRELERSGVVLGVRIGLETGQVVAGEGGQGTLVTGDAVNVAARLEQAAPAGEVLLGAGTHGLIRAAVVAEELQPLTLKGKAEPQPAYRLISVSGRPVKSRRVDAPMVGRERELAALESAFQRCVADRVIGLFTVVGEPGVGKSRLVRELVVGLADTGVSSGEVGRGAAGDIRHAPAVVTGQCLPYGEGITYWPIVEIVRTAAGIGDADRADVARARLDELLGDTPQARATAERIAQVIGLDDRPATQAELFGAVRSLLERLAGNRPLVVLLEDVHWAEPTLLDLVDDVVGHSTGWPILIVASARPELLERRPAWGRPDVSLALDRLPTAASGRLIAGLLPGAALPDALRSRLEAATEGNPLFAEELIAMLVESGDLRVEHGQWVDGAGRDQIPIPATLGTLLGARLDRLAPDDRATAERAAVIGRVFDAAALAELTPPGEREALPRRLAALVDTALVEPLPGSTPSAAPEPSLRFRHILIRDAAYASLSKSTRADLHERLAGWIEQSSGDRLGEVEEIVGYHLEEAHRCLVDLGTLDGRVDSIAGRAAAHLARAARKAVDRSDTPAAANLLSRTAALLDPDDPARGALLVDLGLALREMGEAERADAVLTEVISRADAAGDARLRAHALVQRWLGYDGTHGQMAAAEPDARAALALFEAAGDELGQARAWRLLSIVTWAAGHGAEALAANEQDLAHARRSGRPRELTESICVLSAILYTGPVPVMDGIQRCEAILAAEAGNGPIEGWLAHALAHLRVRLGAFDEARVLATRSVEILRMHGQDYEAAILSELEADVELVVGDADAAVRTLRDGLEVTERAGLPSLMLAAFLARAAVVAGETAAAEQAAELALAGGGWIGAIAQAALGRVRAAQGRDAEADRLTREALDFFDATDCLTFHARALADRAVVLRAAGRMGEAVEALESARTLHERKGSPAEMAQVDRLLAALTEDATLERAPS